MTTTLPLIEILAMMPGMGYWVIFGVTMLASWLVSSTLKRRFFEHSQAPIRFSGKEIAERMLADHGIHDVKVISVPGQLTDHYNPMNRTVNLSESVYHQCNAAAAAVAAHECGHAVQHATAYRWLNFRSAMVPMTNFANHIMGLLAMVMMFGAVAMQNPTILLVYIACLALVALFSIVTLPVEFDASRRAMAWIRRSSVGSSMDESRSQNALYWAAMTYVVGALSSIAMLAYYVMMFLGARSNDD